MRIISLVVGALALVACKSEPRPEAACDRASANAKRLVARNAAARRHYGMDPFPAEHCYREGIPQAKVTCIGYASDWDELFRCGPELLRPQAASR